ncbi:hypothetical protein GALMADRAFT_207968 [Galerina marginata CBS 339.88]|uniref:Uncharacterized protein n=1 Tax=Galerina marginata (strain CBS 339.88) TaxID=685588 RepID=A0A067TFI8_GALM3|nr:hypothetical protein GALMADRAFT_207968 [Galerina marginata CBS 339.88]
MRKGCFVVKKARIQSNQFKMETWTISKRKQLSLLGILYSLKVRTIPMPLLPPLSDTEQSDQYRADIELIGRRNTSDRSHSLTYQDLLDPDDSNDEFSPYEQLSEISSDESTDAETLQTIHNETETREHPTRYSELTRWQTSVAQETVSTGVNSFTMDHAGLVTGLPDNAPNVSYGLPGQFDILASIEQSGNNMPASISPKFNQDWSETPRTSVPSQSSSPHESSTTYINPYLQKPEDLTNPQTTITPAVPVDAYTSPAITNDDILLSRRLAAKESLCPDRPRSTKKTKKKNIPSGCLQTLRFSPLARFRYNRLMPTDHTPNSTTQEHEANTIHHQSQKRKRTKHDYEILSADTHTAYYDGQKHPQIPQSPQHLFSDTQHIERQEPENYSVSVSPSDHEVVKNGYGNIEPTEFLPGSGANINQHKTTPLAWPVDASNASSVQIPDHNTEQWNQISSASLRTKT